MGRIVQIRGDSALFPGDACVHCLSPTTHQVELVKVKPRAVRRIRVPLCETCVTLRDEKPPARLRFERIATAVSFLAAWASGVWIYLMVVSWPASGPRGPVWGALLGLLMVTSVFGVLHPIARLWSLRYQGREAKAIRACVRIQDFDWETTTLAFADAGYADRFAGANPGTCTVEERGSAN